MTCELFCKCSFTGCRDLKENYCCGNPLLCARRRVAVTVGGENVPVDLLPSQSDRILDTILCVLEHKNLSDCGTENLWTKNEEVLMSA
jgi:hypothetical protein